jgi:hypothetical protein
MQSINLIPTAYFGPIRYQALVSQFECKIDRNEFFIKQSLRTRCSINGANGIIFLKVPRNRKNSSKTPIKEIKINYDHPWQKEHWKSIKSAYQSSPFFEYYRDDLKPFFEKKTPYLIDLNTEIQQKLFDIIGINKKLSFSEEFSPYTEKDWRKYNFKGSLNANTYEQVFNTKNNFISDLSILDLLFNLGPETGQFLLNTDTSIKL